MDTHSVFVLVFTSSEPKISPVGVPTWVSEVFYDKEMPKVGEELNTPCHLAKSWIPRLLSFHLIFSIVYLLLPGGAFYILHCDVSSHHHGENFPVTAKIIPV